MAGGYESRPDGAEFFTREFRDIWAAIRALSGANKLTSAVIDKGGVTVEGGGGVVLQEGGDIDVRDGGGINVRDGGSIEVRGSDARGIRLTGGNMRLFDNLDVNSYARVTTTDDALYLRPPGPTEADGSTTLILEGTRVGRTGNAFLIADAGQVAVRSRDSLFLTSTTGNVNINAKQNDVFADRIQLVSQGRGVGVYGLPTTSAVANVRLATIGSDFTLALVSSSARYKTDPAPVEIDLTELLEVTGQTWVDRYELDNSPAGDLRRHVGLFAEHLDQFPSLRQFVDYDDQGRPDAIQYDRFAVALLELGKDHEARIVQLEADRDERKRADDAEARADAAEARADAMEERLTALEGRSNA